MLNSLHLLNTETFAKIRVVSVWSVLFSIHFIHISSHLSPIAATFAMRRRLLSDEMLTYNEYLPRIYLLPVVKEKKMWETCKTTAPCN